jgi:hypothetical protein
VNFIFREVLRQLQATEGLGNSRRRRRRRRREETESAGPKKDIE